MFRIPSFVLALALLSPAFAQPPVPEPPEELEKLDVLLGHWKGEGTANMGPDGPSAPWTSRSHVRRVLGGHFIREDVVIEIQAGPQTMNLAFISLFAWDAERERYVNYMAGNNGAMARADIEFHDGDMVSMSQGYENGHFMTERWVTEVSDGELTYRGLRMPPMGKPFTSIVGTSTRVDEIEPIDLGEITGMMATPSPQMKRLIRMEGHYEVGGDWRMTADSAPVAFEGTERMVALFDGLVLHNIVHGEGYEGFGLTGWDPLARRFTRYAFSSMGEHHQVRGHWVDEHHAAFTFDGTMMGNRYLVRTLMKLDDEGRPIRAWADALQGATPPFRSWEADYTATDEDEGEG